MSIKNFSITAALALFLPFTITSCGSEACRDCDCDIEISETRTYDDGSSESESYTSSRTFTACDSDVNNPNEPSWEYWAADPTTTEERSGSNFSGDYDEEITSDYTCDCEED